MAPQGCSGRGIVGVRLGTGWTLVTQSDGLQAQRPAGYAQARTDAALRRGKAHAMTLVVIAGMPS